MAEDNTSVKVEGKSPLDDLLKNSDISEAIIELGYTLKEVKSALQMSDLTREEIQLFSKYMTMAKHYPDACSPAKDFVVYKLLMLVSHKRKGRTSIEDIMKSALRGASETKNSIMGALKQ